MNLLTMCEVSPASLLLCPAHKAVTSTSPVNCELSRGTFRVHFSLAVVVNKPSGGFILHLDSKKGLHDEVEGLLRR
jgi:hypothetical protein